MESSKRKSADETLNLKTFSLDSIPPGAVVLCIGKRFSGKSWVLRHFMYVLAQRGMGYGVIFSGTEHCSPFFSDFFPNTYIHEDREMTDEALEKIINEQARRCADWKNKIAYCNCYHCRKNPYKFEFQKGHCIHNNMLILADDIMSQDKMMRRSSNFKRLFTDLRHMNAMFVLALQYPLGLLPVQRTNIDYVFLFQEDEQANLKKIYDNYAGVIPSFSMFKDILDQCTDNYGCLVIDKRSKSKNLTDRIFYFKGQDPGPFKFGSKKFWARHYEQNKQVMYKQIGSTGNYKDDEFIKRKIFETYGPSGKRFTVTINE